MIDKSQIEELIKKYDNLIAKGWFGTPEHYVYSTIIHDLKQLIKE